MNYLLKRLLLCLICVVFFVNYFVIAADEQTPFTALKIPGEIISTQYDNGGEGIGYSKGLAPGRGGTVTSFNAPYWMCYTVKIEKDGFYDTTIYYASLNASSTMEISVDGELKFSATLLSTGSWGDMMDLYLGRTKLNSGTHIIQCKMSVGGVNFQKLSFEYYDPAVKIIDFLPKSGSYRNAFIPCVVQAENFDRGFDSYLSKDGANSGKTYRKSEGIDIYEIKKNVSYYILLNKGEYVKYTFNVLQEGAYTLTLKSDGEGAVRLIFDNLPSGMYAEYSGVSGNYEDHDVVNVYLTKGMHSLKIESVSSLVNLDSFEFSHATGDAITLEDLHNGADISLVRQTTEESAHTIYKQLYVEVNGNDHNDGAQKSPFQTLKRAKEEVARLRDDMSGDVIVNIQPGYYQLDEEEVFTNENGGKDGCRVIYRGANLFSPPVFSGGVQVKGWENQDGHIWRAPLSTVSDVRNLYINGIGAQRARSKYVYLGSSAYIEDENTNREDGMVIPALNFPKMLSHPEDMELVWNVDWMSHRTPVKDLKRNRGEVVLVMDQPYYSYALAAAKSNARYPKLGNAFYIENAKELLDEPGEFYYDKQEKAIYYYPFENEDLTTDEVFVGKTEFLMSVKGDSPEKPIADVIFENLDFRYGAWNVTNTTGILTGQADAVRVNGESMMLPAQVKVTCAKDITIQNCRFSSLGSSGISLSNAVSNANIIGNVIQDCSGSGIVIGHWLHTNEMPEGMARCRNIEVANNVIRRVGTEYKSGIGISMYYVNNVNVHNNDIKETSYTGISMGWGWGADIRECADNTVAYNRIENVMGTLRDGGHIYTLGPNRNSTVHDNYCIKTFDYRGGIYTDNGSSYIQYYNNVITKAKHWWYTYSPDMHELLSFNNYSDTATYTNNVPDKVIMKDNVTVEDGNWPQEALNIMNNAGVQMPFKRLLNSVERPEWRTDYTSVFPNKPFRNSEQRTWCEAEDYTDGSSTVVLYGNAKNYSVGDTGDGTWLEYKIEIDQDDEYTLELRYANAFPDNTPQTLLDIYIDGEKVKDKVLAPRTDSWADARIFDLGTLRISAGQHTVRFVFVDNGFAFDRWRFISEQKRSELKNITLTAQDPMYDEGILIKN